MPHLIRNVAERVWKLSLVENLQIYDRRGRCPSPERDAFIDAGALCDVMFSDS
jgi:hypothetical protein